jgi:hypothetical protein
MCDEMRTHTNSTSVVVGAAAACSNMFDNFRDQHLLLANWFWENDQKRSPDHCSISLGRAPGLDQMPLNLTCKNINKTAPLHQISSSYSRQNPSSLSLSLSLKNCVCLKISFSQELSLSLSLNISLSLIRPWTTTTSAVLTFITSTTQVF